MAPVLLCKNENAQVKELKIAENITQRKKLIGLAHYGLAHYGPSGHTNILILTEWKACAGTNLMINNIIAIQTPFCTDLNMNLR